MIRFSMFLILGVLVFSCQKETPQAEQKEFSNKAPENAQVYFISPQDGDIVDTTFTIKFGLKGMGVAPAGTMKEMTGHHHILIDLNEYPDLTKPLPATENIVHFGGGQTETELTLKPGEHSIQLLLGNFAHIPHDKPVLSEKIIITVK